MLIEKVGCSEYGPVFLAEGKAWTYVFVGNKVQVVAYPVSDVTDVTGGQYNAVCVDAYGNAFILYRASQKVAKFNSTGNIACAAFFEEFVLLKSDGSIWYTKKDLIETKIKAPDGVKFVKVLGSHMIYGITDTGDLYASSWKSLGFSKITLPGKVQTFASGRNNFQIAIIDGVPFGWGDGFMLGLSASPSGPTDLRKTWGIDKKITVIDCNDNTIHFITEDGALYGMGSNGNGEVGNGTESPETVKDYNWSWDYRESFVNKPVQIGVGRTYDRISKDNSFSFFVWARETNGVWNSWGRNKGFGLGNGVGMGADMSNKQPNRTDVTSPRRVDPFTMPISYWSEAQIKASYPPAEVAVPNPISYKNVEKSKSFDRSDCKEGFKGSPVTYIVAAGKYSSSISQADADAKADDDVTKNGQAYANTNGECKQVVFYNAELSQKFTKNDCGGDFTGSEITYIVPADKYSASSQSGADVLASKDISDNGQSYANKNGLCSRKIKNVSITLEDGDKEIAYHELWEGKWIWINK